ncbi:RELT-like protein 1 [Ambystoma mexicanum]|uniref:RELT-like protein 1 n=1 Tax=Ambystoma mexicanum TaxID=8296 RepID=UPI0037E78A10
MGNPNLTVALESHGTENTATTATEGGHPEYVAFVLVPVFFFMGLLGFLICHILKKKGYRCTTEAESRKEEEKNAELQIEMNENHLAESNNDTVGQIVNCIMKNEANTDAFNAMVADNSAFGDNSLIYPESPGTPITPNTPGTPVSPGSPLSPTATPSKHTCRGQHFHTVGGVAEKNVCNRCSHKKWHIMKASPKFKEPKRNRQAVTVLSVGRFRVTKVESKSKEQKRLMSDSGEGVNGEAPSTPVKVDGRHRSGTESEIQDQSTIET